MRFKYFLRGLGVGIVFASLIFFMVYKENATPKMSDKQIIERAKELGMVEEGSSIEDILHTSATSEASENKETESTTEKAKDNGIYYGTDNGSHNRKYHGDNGESFDYNRKRCNFLYGLSEITGIRNR